MKPRARQLNVPVTVHEDRTDLQTARGVVAVDALAWRVWSLADGTREVPAIAEALGLQGAEGRRSVWTALDRLADLDLLVERPAPPAAAMPAAGQTGLSRREVFQRLATGLAGGLAVSALLGREAFAQQAGATDKTVKLKEETVKVKEREVKSAETRLSESRQKVDVSERCVQTKESDEKANRRSTAVCGDTAHLREEQVKFSSDLDLKKKHHEAATKSFNAERVEEESAKAR